MYILISILEVNCVVIRRFLLYLFQITYLSFNEE